jgi:hypothetical protein
VNFGHGEGNIRKRLERQDGSDPNQISDLAPLGAVKTLQSENARARRRAAHAHPGGF